jgi:hypothetical protein
VIDPAGHGERRLRAARLGRFALATVSVAVLLVVWVGFTVSGGNPVDAQAFYDLDPAHLYVQDDREYLWSPAFAQLTAPLRQLAFEPFVAVVRGAELIALWVMAPFGAWIAIWLWPVAAEVNAANINLVLMLCVVASFRWPAAWLLPLITKPTMGLGLLWYVARKEWRQLGIALGVTGVVCAVSFSLNPQAWFDWIRYLMDFGVVPGWPFPIPIWVRLPISAVIVWWGARTNRAWAVPLGVVIGMPKLFFLSIAMLIGILPTLGAQNYFMRRTVVGDPAEGSAGG